VAFFDFGITTWKTMNKWQKKGKYSALFFIVISMCYKINFTPNTNTWFLSIKGNNYNQLNLLLIINLMGYLKRELLF